MDQLDINLLRIKAALTKCSAVIENQSDVDLDVVKADLEKISFHPSAIFLGTPSPREGLQKNSQIADAKVASDPETFPLAQPNKADMQTVSQHSAGDFETTPGAEIERAALWRKIYKMLRVFS